MRIHRGPGDSVSKQRPNIHTRLNSDREICLLDWGSPYTLQSLDLPAVDTDCVVPYSSVIVYTWGWCRNSGAATSFA